MPPAGFLITKYFLRKAYFSIQALFFEKRIIQVRYFLPCGRPLIQVLQFHGENSRLQCIQPAVDAHIFMVIFGSSPVQAKDIRLFSHGLILHSHQSAVSVGSEVFTWKKAEASEISDTSRPLSFVLGTDRLCCIFNHIQVVFFRQFHEGIHIGHLSIQMNRDNRLDLFRFRVNPLS